MTYGLLPAALLQVQREWSGWSGMKRPWQLEHAAGSVARRHARFQPISIESVSATRRARARALVHSAETEATTPAAVACSTSA